MLVSTLKEHFTYSLDDGQIVWINFKYFYKHCFSTNTALGPHSFPTGVPLFSLSISYSGILVFPKLTDLLLFLLGFTYALLSSISHLRGVTLSLSSVIM